MRVVVLGLGLSLAASGCSIFAPPVGEGEGEGDVVGEGEGDVVGEGEGELGEGEGELGEGEGDVVGEGEGDVVGEGEGEGDVVGEGEGEAEAACVCRTAPELLHTTLLTATPSAPVPVRFANSVMGAQRACRIANPLRVPVRVSGPSTWALLPLVADHDDAWCLEGESLAGEALPGVVVGLDCGAGVDVVGGSPGPGLQADPTSPTGAACVTARLTDFGASTNVNAGASATAVALVFGGLGAKDSDLAGAVAAVGTTQFVVEHSAAQTTIIGPPIGGVGVAGPELTTNDAWHVVVWSHSGTGLGVGRDGWAIPDRGAAAPPFTGVPAINGKVGAFWLFSGGRDPAWSQATALSLGGVLLRPAGGASLTPVARDTPLVIGEAVSDRFDLRLRLAGRNASTHVKFGVIEPPPADLEAVLNGVTTATRQVIVTIEPSGSINRICVDERVTGDSDVVCAPFDVAAEDATDFALVATGDDLRLASDGAALSSGLESLSASFRGSRWSKGANGANAACLAFVAVRDDDNVSASLDFTLLR